MFQTDLIIYLQSFSSPLLDAFFLLVTSLGDESFIQVLVIALIFGVDFRRGFLLLQLIMVNAVATGILKQAFALPRPFNVDASIQVPGGSYGGQAVSDAGGADKFFGPLPQATVDHFRTQLPNSFGLPSGHTSSAVTIWGGLAVLFKKKWLISLSILIIVLIPLSRLYLGRHFPADVLGGYLLGGVLLLAFHWSVFRSRRTTDAIFGRRDKSSTGTGFLSLLVLLGFGAPILLLVFGLEAERAAMWLGINAGFLFVRQRGLPDDKAPLIQRMGRVAVAAGLFYALDAGAAPLIRKSEAAGLFLLKYPIIVVMVALFIWLATEIVVKLGWMNRKSLN